MISVVICSANGDHFHNVEKNIISTIGVNHEIIKVDNTARDKSIAQAYNYGASLAQYDILCFLHEDVEFNTLNWGKRLLAHFENLTNVGLIGVAGTIFKSRMSSGWWETEKNWPDIKRVNLIQHYQQGRPAAALFNNPNNEAASEVVAIDGVFMATTKAIWQHNQLDENVIKGFHAYDLDFSFQIGRQYKVYVIYDVLLTHFSSGNTNLSWMMDTLRVHKKWQNVLPLKTNEVQIKGLYKYSWQRLRKNMHFLINQNASFKIFFKSYYQFCNLLDEKPAWNICIKHRFIEFARLFKQYVISNKVSRKL